MAALAAVAGGAVALGIGAAAGWVGAGETVVVGRADTAVLAAAPAETPAAGTTDGLASAARRTGCHIRPGGPSTTTARLVS